MTIVIVQSSSGTASAILCQNTPKTNSMNCLNARSPQQKCSTQNVPFARTLRWRLKYTQEEFASRFAIPLGTLRDWEQGRSEPDAPAKAYLKVISAEPEAVARALNPQVA
jgi:putative transcriptional regulator